jgi:hypothetical protein
MGKVEDEYLEDILLLNLQKIDGSATKIWKIPTMPFWLQKHQQTSFVFI